MIEQVIVYTLWARAFHRDMDMSDEIPVDFPAANSSTNCQTQNPHVCLYKFKGILYQKPKSTDGDFFLSTSFSKTLVSIL